MNKYPPVYEAKGEALEKYLTELFDVKTPEVVSVYARANDGFRISEVSIHSETSGCSWMRGDGTVGGLALILACEDFVLDFDTKPYRPQGWTSDIDEFADAKFRLQNVVASLTATEK